MAHLKRWDRLFDWDYVVEHTRYPGRPIGDIEKALTTACERLASVASLLTASNIQL
jgi:hypothetical protein